MAGRGWRVHAPWLHSAGFHAAVQARRLRRLAVPLPWLAVRRGGSGSSGTGTSQSGRAALQLSLRYQDQDRLRHSMRDSYYEPKTAFGRWLDTRLPIIRFANDHLMSYRTP